MPYTLAYLGGMVPTQAEGRTGDDRPFYFRARGGVWAVSVGQPGENPDTDDEAATRLYMQGDDTRIESGPDETYGAMDDAEVRMILNNALRQFEPTPEES